MSDPVEQDEGDEVEVEVEETTETVVEEAPVEENTETVVEEAPDGQVAVIEEAAGADVRQDEEGQTVILEPTETIRMPAHSWAPAVFAAGILGLVAGTFATGFFIPAWWLAVAGAGMVLLSLRKMVRRGVRDFYGLPREKEPPRSELPVESFSAPRLDESS
jgi:hypothetical protein